MDAYRRITTNTGRFMPTQIEPSGMRSDTAALVPGRGAREIIAGAGRDLGVLGGSVPNAALVGLMNEATLAIENVGLTPEGSPSEQQSNATQRVSRLLRQLQMPYGLPPLPYPTRREVVILVNDALLLNSDRMPGFRTPADMADATVKKRLDDSRILLNQRPVAHVAYDLASRAQALMSHAVQRLHSRSMIASLAQINYYLAVAEAHRYHDALFAPGQLPRPSAHDTTAMMKVYKSRQYRDFFNNAVFKDSPAFVWHSFFAFDGVMNDESDTSDIDPVMSRNQLPSRAVANVKHGPADMWDYTNYAGLTPGASVSLVIRPAPVTAKTRYYMGSDHQGIKPQHDSNIPFGVDGALLGDHTIYPKQVHVVFWPDGNRPPVEYGAYASYPHPVSDAPVAAGGGGGAKPSSSGRSGGGGGGSIPSFTPSSGSMPTPRRGLTPAQQEKEKKEIAAIFQEIEAVHALAAQVVRLDTILSASTHTAHWQTSLRSPPAAITDLQKAFAGLLEKLRSHTFAAGLVELQPPVLQPGPVGTLQYYLDIMQTTESMQHALHDENYMPFPGAAYPVASQWKAVQPPPTGTPAPQLPPSTGSAVVPVDPQEVRLITRSVEYLGEEIKKIMNRDTVTLNIGDVVWRESVIDADIDTDIATIRDMVDQVSTGLRANGLRALASLMGVFVFGDRRVDKLQFLLEAQQAAANLLAALASGSYDNVSAYIMRTTRKAVPYPASAVTPSTGSTPVPTPSPSSSTAVTPTPTPTPIPSSSTAVTPTPPPTPIPSSSAALSWVDTLKKKVNDVADEITTTMKQHAHQNGDSTVSWNDDVDTENVLKEIPRVVKKILKFAALAAKHNAGMTRLFPVAPSPLDAVSALQYLLDVVYASRNITTAIEANDLNAERLYPSRFRVAAANPASSASSSASAVPPLTPSATQLDALAAQQAEKEAKIIALRSAVGLKDGLDAKDPGFMNSFITTVAEKANDEKARGQLLGAQQKLAFIQAAADTCTQFEAEIKSKLSVLLQADGKAYAATITDEVDRAAKVSEIATLAQRYVAHVENLSNRTKAVVAVFKNKTVALGGGDAKGVQEGLVWMFATLVNVGNPIRAAAAGAVAYEARMKTEKEKAEDDLLRMTKQAEIETLLLTLLANTKEQLKIAAVPTTSHAFASRTRARFAGLTPASLGPRHDDNVRPLFLAPAATVPRPYRGADGVIFSFARVMFHTLIHANGRNGYRPPPAAHDLTPVTDMRTAQQRPPVPILICEGKHGFF
jgi:hypothetical protein